jgi:dihydroflavonol-4-reductase
VTEAPAWLVTGATGFLGRHLLLTLRRRMPAARLVVLARDRRAWRSLDWTASLGAVDVVAGSLRPTASWWDDPRLQGVQGIFHLAAIVHHSRRGADTMFHTNVAGTAAMTELAARLACRLLFVSTSGTVSCSPRPGEGAFEDGGYCDHVVGRWPYYASKIAAERQARQRATALGVQLVIFRPPILLGPGDHRFRSTSSVLRLLQGRLPAIVRGGMHFADVRDGADAMVQAMRISRPRPVYHLVGTASTLDEFFRGVAAVAGLPLSWRVLPAGLLRSAARLNAALGSPVSALPDPVLVEMASHHWDHRSRFAETDLGYRARPAVETLRDTVQWLRDHHPELRAAPGDAPAARTLSQ